MAINIDVRQFSGSYAGLNGQHLAQPVGLAEVVNKAITVGGVVSGSPLQKTRRRAAIANTVLASIQRSGPPTVRSDLGTTTLYDHTETTEKSGVSFRLGMAFAAVVSGRVLHTTTLMHVSGSGRRADLIGFDRARALHVVEAKCRTYGLNARIRRDAKAQATATASALAAAGRVVSTASAALTDLSTRPITVSLEDPPVLDDGGGAFFFEDADFFREYYSPVLDLLETDGEQVSGIRAVDAEATGAFLTRDVWLGLSSEVLSRVDGRGAWVAPVEVTDQTAVDDLDRISRTADGHVLALGGPSWSGDVFE